VERGSNLAKFAEADFYYGAVLSKLIHEKICPVLIDGNRDRQVYEFATNDGDFRLFVKYRSTPNSTQKDGYNSNDLKELKQYIKDAKHLSVGLVCGNQQLNESEYAVLHKEDIEELFIADKRSFTISRMAHEKAFRLFVEDGSRGNARKIPSNRLY